MGGKWQVGVAWLARFVRGRRLDRNPLRRGSDRLETVVLALLVAVFLAAAPFAAWACGTLTHAIAHRVQLEQQASRHQVSAVLLQAAPASGESGLDTLVLVRWTAPDGTVLTGDVPASAGAAAGTSVRVWIGDDGRLAQPPLLDSQVAGQVDLAETGGVIVLGGVVLLVGAFTRRAFDKRRIAAWDAEWRAAGPRWTTRA